MQIGWGGGGGAFGMGMSGGDGGSPGDGGSDGGEGGMYGGGGGDGGRLGGGAGIGKFGGVGDGNGRVGGDGGGGMGDSVRSFTSAASCSVVKPRKASNWSQVPSLLVSSQFSELGSMKFTTPSLSSSNMPLSGGEAGGDGGG